MRLLQIALVALPLFVSAAHRHYSSTTMMLQQKTAVRNAVKVSLSHLSAESIVKQSADIASTLFTFNKFTGCKAVCIYLSMPNEVSTYPIVEHCLREKKRVFIPKVTGKRPADMVLYELTSFDEIERFPRSKWGIPEPDMSSLDLTSPERYFDLIDLIIVPGVAFDRQCSRVGHGKGYYDCFISRIHQTCTGREGATLPLKVALSLQEQMFPEVPCAEHDQELDYIVTPTEIIGGN